MLVERAVMRDGRVLPAAVSAIRVVGRTFLDVLARVISDLLALGVLAESPTPEHAESVVCIHEYVGTYAWVFVSWGCEHFAHP